MYVLREVKSRCSNTVPRITGTGLDKTRAKIMAGRKKKKRSRTCDHDGLDVFSQCASVVYSVASVSITTAADETAAGRSPTVALGRLVAVALKVVVKLNLASSGDVASTEEPNLELTLDDPLFSLAIWLAAVVDEASTIPFSARVNHLQQCSCGN
jgi:hypothetical protein